MDASLFHSLLLAELDALWRFARHLARDDHRASDLVQETCAKALAGADGFSPRGGGIRSWLMCICHNLWRNQKRDGRFECNGTADGFLEDAAIAPAPTPIFEIARLDWEQVDERLKRAIEGLPATHRLPLLLWAVEDMPYREIAQVLDIPIGTVMSRLSRARGMLTAALADLAAERGLATRRG